MVRHEGLLNTCAKLMSFYRIYDYPGKSARFKHIYFGRDRPVPRVDDEGDREGETEPKEYVGRLLPRVYRTRRYFRVIVLCNPLELFCTFTFSPKKIDRYDYAECKRRLVKFFNNYRVRYSPIFRYAVAGERHRDNAFHFHGVVRGIRPEDFHVPMFLMKRHPLGFLHRVPNTPGYLTWTKYEQSFGWFSCSLIRDREKCANYVIKYITKDSETWAKGTKILLASQDLKRPQLVYDEDNIPLTFYPEYQDEFCAMSYRRPDETVGMFLPEWYGECCSDLNDTFVDLPFGMDGLSVEPFSVEQLKFIG